MATNIGCRQIVNPTLADLRDRPLYKVQAIVYENRIELIPQRPMKKMRGFLKGVDTDVPRGHGPA